MTHGEIYLTGVYRRSNGNTRNMIDDIMEMNLFITADNRWFGVFPGHTPLQFPKGLACLDDNFGRFPVEIAQHPVVNINAVSREAPQLFDKTIQPFANINPFAIMRCLLYPNGSTKCILTGT